VVQAEPNFDFQHKPLLIGCKAMEYYGIRQAGKDIDLVIAADDHKRLVAQYPNHIKDLHGDIGVCTFDYGQLKDGA
jgi:hypothetical protein